MANNHPERSSLLNARLNARVTKRALLRASVLLGGGLALAALTPSSSRQQPPENTYDDTTFVQDRSPKRDAIVNTLSAFDREILTHPQNFPAIAKKVTEEHEFRSLG